MNKSLHLQEYPDRGSSFSLSTPPTPESPASPPTDLGDDGGYTSDQDMDDDHFDDNDSGLGGSLIGYDTQTISSLITDYRYENGRRYHAYRDGEYWVILSPNFHT
jgi:hypothetical protein